MLARAFKFQLYNELRGQSQEEINKLLKSSTKERPFFLALSRMLASLFQQKKESVLLYCFCQLFAKETEVGIFSHLFVEIYYGSVGKPHEE
mmetsp:Transcript_52944/g.63751  ORF Transcript_52944/g.63751 Transcript_52944/m.63751 type:complete len:91 (-) Transcript_52944:961-1233(-)